jgi:hypothetical protein
MKAKPDFKFGDRVIRIGGSQKRGVVSRIFQSGGLWWLAFEGEPNWRYEPRYFRRVAYGRRPAPHAVCQAGRVSIRFPPHLLHLSRRPVSGTAIDSRYASTFTSALCPQA